MAVLNKGSDTPDCRIQYLLSVQQSMESCGFYYGPAVSNLLDCFGSGRLSWHVRIGELRLIFPNRAFRFAFRFLVSLDLLYYGWESKLRHRQMDLNFSDS